MAKATVSFCPNLTDPDAESVALFIVSDDDGLGFSFLQSHSATMECIGKDELTKEIVSNFHWFLAIFYEEVGSEEFMPRLVKTLRYSNLYVSDVTY